MQSETITSPVVSAGQNGPATADTETIFFDTLADPSGTKTPTAF